MLEKFLYRKLRYKPKTRPKPDLRETKFMKCCKFDVVKETLTSENFFKNARKIWSICLNTDRTGEPIRMSNIGKCFTKLDICHYARIHN
jgi:hypothetical protein